ncbi:MAG: ABC transporter ATP-binding protein [Lachnospiraceae bacterium]|nr:ABC transporter ATP-binding protein [Lachnospiraceae bacterium]
MRKLISIHRTGFRLLKMIHSADSTIIPLHLLDLCLSLAQVYAGLFLTAELIDMLLLGKFEQAAVQALWLLGVNLFLGLCGQLLRRKFKSSENRIWLIFYVWLREKAFSLDYETMENPKVSEKILFSERTSDMYGGLGTLLNYYCSILQALLNIVLSVSLVFWLCMAEPAGEFGLLGRMAGPVPSILMFAAVLAGMCFCAWKVVVKYAAKQQEIFESHTGMENKLGYLLNQVFGNVKTGKIIRIYGMEEMLLENAAREQRKFHSYYAKMCDISRKEGSAGGLVNSFFTMGAYLLVSLKVVTGAVTVGAFTRYVGALNQFGSSCIGLITWQRELRKISTYMEDFLAFLDTENLHAAGSIPVEKRQDGEYELAFENVSFCYPGSREPALKNVNCRLRIRGKLAVVGRNGAGKTTFIKLLCRLYEPTEGRITLNGVDIRKYSEEEYRSLFGVVFQDFKLFALPVWENVTAGYERQEEKIWEALGQADAEELVRGMEKGLDTYLYRNLEEGVEISGGEAQKLALARALYKAAPVVILDEPTAALDPKAEAEIYARFGEMVKGRTSIYISHRMSSCRFCDEIIVFQEGRIAERGSHEELLTAGGCYTEMWNAQAKYYA